MKQGCHITNIHNNDDNKEEEESEEMIRYTAYRAALRRGRKIETGSKVYDPEKEDQLKRVEKQELEVKELLGHGTFCNVYDVRYNNKSYAMKCLRKDILRKRIMFKTGAADLLTETKFLACLHHPHIISIHAISASGISGFLHNNQEEEYFLIIDKLQENLTQLIQRKRKFQKQLSKSDYRKRLQMALNISQALQYLHSHNILMRDVKCDNIGLDSQEKIKLFDLGLATELKYSNVKEDGTYHLTKKAGSLKYMAPENSLGQSYNLYADVYSFSIVLWELLCLNTAFQEFSTAAVFQEEIHASNNPHRPSLEYGMLSPSIKCMLQQSWSQSWKERPNMDSITTTLQSELDSTNNKPTPSKPQYLWKHVIRRSNSKMQRVSAV